MIKDIFKKDSEELGALFNDLGPWHEQLAEATKQIKEALKAGKKILVAGNGGSATLAQHLSDEMVGRYRTNRAPYPVIALTADSAVITCIGNDFGFDDIFKRQVEALGSEGDIFIAYSTSGNSANILSACEQARAQGMTVVAFTGSKGKLKDMADYPVVSPAKRTARIQELDLHAVHLLCEALEPDHLAEE